MDYHIGDIVDEGLIFLRSCAPFWGLVYWVTGLQEAFRIASPLIGLQKLIFMHLKYSSLNLMVQNIPLTNFNGQSINWLIDGLKIASPTLRGVCLKAYMKKPHAAFCESKRISHEQLPRCKRCTTTELC